ncbi:hypothetical protein PR003_g14971 [Phytophthora rubi]|uniref:Uncharacterized protein n=1 Tax=Phytophthora rubi TaxID=129364 RepID=A0A6A4F2N2_9STRA|nr:hypothetical protein PR003_g14971 [Phytophthora rubi]
MKPELLKLKEKRPQEDHGGLQGELSHEREEPLSRFEDLLESRPALPPAGYNEATWQHYLHETLLFTQSSYIKKLLCETLPCGFKGIATKQIEEPVNVIWRLVETHYRLSNAAVTARCAVISQPQGDDRHPERYPTNTTNTHKKRNDPIRFTDATDTALLTKVLVHNPERGCGLAEAHAELDDLLVNVAELCEEEEAHQEEEKKLHDNRKEDDEQAETMPDEATVGMKKGEGAALCAAGPDRSCEDLGRGQPLA